jgi:hypothetical protein
MNLIETLVFATLTVGLIALGHFLSIKWGTAGWLVCVVPVGLFWAWVMLATIRGTFKLLQHRLNPRPMCRQGKCRPRDYVLLTSMSEKAVFRCRCGDRYLSKGGHFSQILPDGSLLPYMAQDSSRRWKTDTGETPN